MIIVGIVIYTVHLPKTAAESNAADGKELSCVPVSYLSVSYQNSSSVNDSAAVEVQVASQDCDNTCTDQLMSKHDTTESLQADDCVKSQQHQKSPSVAFL